MPRSFLALWLGLLLAAACAAAAAAPAPSPRPAAAAAGNPLLATGDFPAWDKIKPEHVVPGVTAMLEQEAASLELLEQDLSRAVAAGNVSYEEVFGPYRQLSLRMDAVLGQVDHLASVMDSGPLRDAVDAVSPLRVAFGLRLGQSKPLYTAVKALRDTPRLWGGLSEEQRRLVNITLQGFVDSGVGLAPAPRARFNAIADRLTKLSTNFSNNGLDSIKAFDLVITDKARVAGLEQSTLAVAAAKAAAAGRANATTAAGPWKFTLDGSTYSAIMGYAQDRSLRRAVYEAYQRIASAPPSDNGPIIREILTLRREQARLLGYKDYASYSAASKARRGRRARGAARLGHRPRVAPAAVAEDAVLTAFARNATGDAGLELLWWDRAYWAERRKEALFSLKQEELRQYLPLDSVMAGLFQLARRLYGIEIRPVASPPPVWHPDVKVYAVSDAASPDTPLAYFYTDLFARPGQKEGGAWVQPFGAAAAYRLDPSPAAAAAAAGAGAGARGGAAPGAARNNASASVRWSAPLEASTRAWLAGAPRRLPLAIVVANQDPPADGKPSLMTMDEVETVFHEFGHALQHMLTNTSEGLLSGMRGIEWDAVEVPSLMQEKFVYDKGTFDSFAKHWQTGKPAPPGTFDAVKGALTYRKGTYTAGQLVYGTTDLLLHTTYDPTGPTPPNAVHQAQYDKLMAYKHNPNDRQLNNFGHIFSGGYAAAYYSYMWADVMAADAFTAFLEAGASSAQSALGRRFRATFLSSGGAVPPGQVFKNFRGRAPSVTPLLKYNGLL
ncbi:hypothetical protein HT031_000691 [Scenedesmus sp. PABB004]|nr:hypothetical protein HT031_000691 [Scenedesmus sp. PABB004]